MNTLKGIAWGSMILGWILYIISFLNNEVGRGESAIAIVVAGLVFDSWIKERVANDPDPR